MHLLRHTWATTYADRVITQYEDGVITAEEYDDARERLCYLMCHSRGKRKISQSDQNGGIDF